MLSEPGVIQWLDAVKISTKEKTVAGKDAIKAELGLTEQQDTPQYTGKPMPRSSEYVAPK